MQFDDIFVFELGKEHDFAVGALCICGVLEGVEYFFEGENLASFLVWDFPDVTVGSASNFFEELILGENVGLYLICHKRVE